jgi:hypothetical protein
LPSSKGFFVISLSVGNFGYKCILLNGMMELIELLKSEKLDFLGVVFEGEIKCCISRLFL